MKKANLLLSTVVITAMIIISCEGGESEEASPPKEIYIGGQVWMTENLNVDKFRNGDPIKEARTNEEWKKAGKNGEPAWCYFNNNPDNGDRYGKLYNWYAVNDPRGLAPEGWKIPSDKEWSRLTDFLGGEDFAGRKMKFTDFWSKNNGESGNGTNESGFRGLPSGSRDGLGNFDPTGKWGYWWSSTEFGNYGAWIRYLENQSNNANKNFGNLEAGYSVRCLRN